MTQLSKPGYLGFIHNLRGLAIALIVAVHCRGYRADWGENIIGHKTSIILFDNSTIIFVFIAGFLFNHLYAQSFDFSKYLTKKAWNVLLPYVLVSVPIILFRLLFGAGDLPLPHSFDSNPVAYKVLYYLSMGLHLTPLWFMPMIFIIYLLAPILGWLASRGSFNLIFTIILMAGLFTFRPEYNANPILSTIHFLPIYIAGIWANQNVSGILNIGHGTLILLVLGYLAIVFGEFSDLIPINGLHHFEQSLKGDIRFNFQELKLLMLTVIFMVAFSKVKKEVRWLKILANYSFGIYFIHYYFLSIFRFLAERLQVPIEINFLGYLVVLVVVLGLSVLTVWIVKKIFGGYSRMVIGS